MKNLINLSVFILFITFFMFTACATTESSNTKSEVKNEKVAKKLSEMTKEEYREILKEDWATWEKHDTDQKKELPQLPIQKPYPKDAILFDLVKLENIKVGDLSLKKMIEQRRSRRSFTEESLTLEELSYLLWATQGISQTFKNEKGEIEWHTRTVPSGGSKHSFETYLSIHRVVGLKPGLYRYLPIEHKLLLIREDNNIAEKAGESCFGATFVKESAVVFYWTTIPYRTEWRYSFLSPKIIAQDSGHLCQNLYLAAESIGGGTCGIDGYSQKLSDELLGVDGKEEFTVYVAPVGKILLKKEIKPDTKILDKYIGKYERTPYSIVEITKDGDSLFVQPIKKYDKYLKQKIFFDSEITFYLDPTQKETLTFVFDDKGAVTHYKKSKSGKDSLMKKLPDNYQIPDRKNIELDPKTSEIYIGNYVSEKEKMYTFKIFEKSGKLFIKPSWEGELLMLPESESLFFFENDPDQTLKFIKDDKGKVDKIEIISEDEKQHFKKID